MTDGISQVGCCEFIPFLAQSNPTTTQSPTSLLPNVRKCVIGDPGSYGPLSNLNPELRPLDPSQFADIGSSLGMQDVIQAPGIHLDVHSAEEQGHTYLRLTAVDCVLCFLCSNPKWVLHVPRLIQKPWEPQEVFVNFSLLANKLSSQRWDVPDCCCRCSGFSAGPPCRDWWKVWILTFHWMLPVENPCLASQMSGLVLSRLWCRQHSSGVYFCRVCEVLFHVASSKPLGWKTRVKRDLWWQMRRAAPGPWYSVSKRCALFFVVFFQSISGLKCGSLLFPFLSQSIVYLRLVTLRCSKQM